MRKPVLLLVFNRPSNTLRVFNALRDIRVQSLYVACDGPRDKCPEDYNNVAQVQDIVKNLDWECQVSYLFREKNLGCKDAVVAAIDWFFSQEEEGIILEDDTLPAPGFFEYCENALHYYRDRQEVGAIVGHSLIAAVNSLDRPRHVDFVGYALLWGWATWRRVWEGYDKDMISWNPSNVDFLKSLPYSSPRFIYSWSNTFNLTKDNQIDTWDYQFYHLLFSKKLLIVVPPHNLISNIGYGSDATHTQGSPPPWLIDSRELKPVNTLFTEPDINLKLTHKFLSEIFGINLVTNATYVLKIRLIRAFYTRMRSLLCIR